MPPPGTHGEKGILVEGAASVKSWRPEGINCVQKASSPQCGCKAGGWWGGGAERSVGHLEHQPRVSAEPQGWDPQTVKPGNQRERQRGGGCLGMRVGGATALSGDTLVPLLWTQQLSSRYSPERNTQTTGQRGRPSPRGAWLPLYRIHTSVCRETIF